MVTAVTSVIPAKAGIRGGVAHGAGLDPRFRGDDAVQSREGVGRLECPWSPQSPPSFPRKRESRGAWRMGRDWIPAFAGMTPCRAGKVRSEEHTSELQS